MFLEELTPFLKELTQQPIAFLGGFFSGAFRLKVSEDPLKSWLEKQGVAISPDPSNNGYNEKPQSISIE
ncbi:hypothetical protein IQ249_25290 [Lusitaniella coriacea LEGE 07157]|uniref:Uncharacterized protein n=1 Tax=Lusitaniella coriacea LEGE 07157 TaxID=945747 RepID=A0A8J7IYS5_9CYAN|nr:hypothetical protein [Lusitaniella coriacea]MBE9119173.1 hypothetical protein [Lusitaniella coriacea LEGE 07157]